MIKANNAECWQTGKRLDARSMATAGTKPQGSAADEQDPRESAKAAGGKAERNRQYDNTTSASCGKEGDKQRGCPLRKQGKAGKGVHGKSHG